MKTLMAVFGFGATKAHTGTGTTIKAITRPYTGFRTYGFGVNGKMKAWTAARATSLGLFSIFALALALQPYTQKLGAFGLIVS